MSRLDDVPDENQGSSAPIESLEPATGQVLGRVAAATTDDYEQAVAAAQARFAEWRLRPAPVRGRLVARLGELLRAHKAELGEIISREVGKIRSEGLGEVQEM